ncbi:hypothetical protein NP493_190g01015 [Ridgeia piscesae]|uniref:Uncharacterized protein n=1 Tax=Ridgeia piscesae TaxID=27915 RepID=A0AAD9P263_RIDPI|nr:hypothetical protein NP493_190g01015 [Ridgeia piscesae]
MEQLGHARPPSLALSRRSELDETATDWRGKGGRKLTPGSVDFDRQLDKVSIWLDLWDHKQRCAVVTEIVTWSSYRQLRFLWTVVQPALHRDFTYAANCHFPPLYFPPISTYITRHVKRKRSRQLQRLRIHRTESAYLQLMGHLTGPTNLVRLPQLAGSLQSLASSETSTGLNRVCVSLPNVTEGSVVTQSPRDALIQTAIFDGTAKRTVQWLHGASPCLRLCHMLLHNSLILIL